MATAPRTYAPVQADYMHAKVSYDAALAYHADYLETHGFYGLLEAGDTETLARMEYEAQKQSRLDETMDAFLTAQKALFAWGYAKARTAQRAKKHADERTMVDTMFANIDKYPHLKDKLAGICLKLEAKN
jgi:hypothetical protein